MRYEGQFQHGSKHGAGIYKSATGVVYEGQFKRLRQLLPMLDVPLTSFKKISLLSWRMGLKDLAGLRNDKMDGHGVGSTET